MSSLVDAVLASENPGLDSAGPSGRDERVRSARRVTPFSSSKPRGPPTESQGPQTDDVEAGFPDDEVVGLRGNVKNGARQPSGQVPRVVDVTGETVQQTFEEFLQEFDLTIALCMTSN